METKGCSHCISMPLQFVILIVSLYMKMLNTLNSKIIGQSADSKIGKEI